MLSINFIAGLSKVFLFIVISITRSIIKYIMNAEYLFVFVFFTDVPINETGFNNWQNGHINGGTSQNCVLFRRDSAIYEDDPCNNALPFFCEQDF